MPRIYDSTSDPIDYCRRCFDRHFPTEAKAFAEHGDKGDGPDGRGNCFGYDSDHPPYEHEDYCAKCKRPLTADDN
jgi:hypothetical protein